MRKTARSSYCDLTSLTQNLNAFANSFESIVMKLRLSLTESLLAAILLGGLGIVIWQSAGANRDSETNNTKVSQGVPQHHWPFGNMPPLPQVTDAQTPTTVLYVQELQEANGIFYQSHQM